jgi:peptidoglycan hydrolase CwlO-like protein
MPKNTPTASPEILEAALQGLESQRQKLEEQIAQVRSLLGRRVGRPPRTASQSEQVHAANGDGRKRSLSEEARKRIAAAQKRRWAAYRKSQSKG